MNHAAFVADTQNSMTPPICDVFLGFLDLPDLLQARIRQNSSTIKSLNPPESIFVQEPRFSTDLERVELELLGINHTVLSYRDKNPVGAYSFLSASLGELERIDGIKNSPHYLRFMGEWIATASHSAAYLSGLAKAQFIEQLIVSHIHTITEGADIFAEDLKLSEDTIFMYRDKLLNTIVNLAFFYSRTGDYESANRLSRIGSRVATLFYSAQIKFDLLILEIGTLLNQEKFERGDIDELIKLARNGLIVLENTYKNSNPELTARAKNQLRVLEIFLATKRANLNHIPSIAQILRERDNLMQNLNIDDGERQRLLHIEILIYVAFKNMQTDQLLIARDKYRDDFDYVLNAQGKINTHGFDLDIYLEKPNARFFLGPLIELFEFRVRELSSTKNTTEELKKKAFNMMIEIYRIAVGIGEKGLNRMIFKKLSFFPSFIKCAKILLLQDDHHNSGVISDDAVLNWIENEISRKELAARATYESLKEEIIAHKWKGTLSIARIEVTNLTGGIEHDTRVLFEGKQEEDQGITVIDEHPFNGKLYRIKITTNQLVRIEKQFIVALLEDIERLLPYNEKMITSERLRQTIKRLDHDFMSSIASAHGLGMIVADQIGEVRGTVGKIAGLPGNPAQTVDALLMLDGELQQISGTLDVINQTLGNASGFSRTLSERVQDVLGGETRQIEKESISIIPYLRQQLKDEFSTQIQTEITSSDADMEIQANLISLPYLIRNLRQNVFRYKKPEQGMAILEISLFDDENFQYITFKDFGIGMDNTTIKAYKGETQFTKESSHKDSKRVGSSSIMEIVRAHGWTLEIESNYDDFANSEKYTAITLRIPKPKTNSEL